MRILFITQWFDPEPSFKGLTLAKALQKQGHDVEVLTGFPNYPGGHIYPGYRLRVLQRQLIDGIHINRVLLYPSHDLNPLRRIANYLSFALSATVLGPFVTRPADIAYVYHPPASVGLPAIVMHLLRGIPFIYDVQDLWPETLAATGMLSHPALLEMVDFWCRLVYRFSAKIIVLSPGFKEYLVKRGIPAHKIEIIYNWCDESIFYPHEPDNILVTKYCREEWINIVFAGTMGKAQALDTVLDAASILKTYRTKVRFILVGGGHRTQRIHNVYIPPRVEIQLLVLSKLRPTN